MVIYKGSKVRERRQQGEVAWIGSISSWRVGSVFVFFWTCCRWSGYRGKSLKLVVLNCIGEMDSEPTSQGLSKVYDYSEGVSAPTSDHIYLFISVHFKQYLNQLNMWMLQLIWNPNCIETYWFIIFFAFSPLSFTLLDHSQTMVTLVTSRYWGHGSLHLECPIRLPLSSTGARHLPGGMKRVKAGCPGTSGAVLCPWRWRELCGTKTYFCLVVCLLKNVLK